jgi:hypothetical protein
MKKTSPAGDAARERNHNRQVQSIASPLPHQSIIDASAVPLAPASDPDARRAVASITGEAWE